MNSLWCIYFQKKFKIDISEQLLEQNATKSGYSFYISRFNQTNEFISTSHAIIRKWGDRSEFINFNLLAMVRQNLRKIPNKHKKN